jgi:hypothetical protein
MIGSLSIISFIRGGFACAQKYTGTLSMRVYGQLEIAPFIRARPEYRHKWMADVPYTATIRYIASDAQPLRMQAQCRSAGQSMLCRMHRFTPVGQKHK